MEGKGDGGGTGRGVGKGKALLSAEEEEKATGDRGGAEGDGKRRPVVIGSGESEPSVSLGAAVAARV